MPLAGNQEGLVMKQTTKQQQERERRVTSSGDALCKEPLRLTRDCTRSKRGWSSCAWPLITTWPTKLSTIKICDRGFEGVGERQFDTCFEMGDSQDVIAALIKSARAEGFIDNVQIWCGQESFDT